MIQKVRIHHDLEQVLLDKYPDEDRIIVNNNIQEEVEFRVRLQDDTIIPELVGKTQLLVPTSLKGKNKVQIIDLWKHDTNHYYELRRFLPTPELTFELHRIEISTREKKINVYWNIV